MDHHQKNVLLCGHYRGGSVLSLETLNVRFLLDSIPPTLLVACEPQPNLQHLVRRNDQSNAMVLIVLHHGCRVDW